jgi:hypothetical protein
LQFAKRCSVVHVDQRATGKRPVLVDAAFAPGKEHAGVFIAVGLVVATIE